MEVTISENINSADLTHTEHSLEEYTFKPEGRSFSLTNSISCLQQQILVVYISSKEKKCLVSMYLNTSLDNLYITNNDNRTITIPSREIIEASLSLIIQVQREEDNLYPMNIKTKIKKYLVAFHSSHEREVWYISINTFLKYCRDFNGLTGLRYYCEGIIRNQGIRGKLQALTDSKKSENNKMQRMENRIIAYEKESIKELLNSIISKVEEKANSDKIANLSLQIKSSTTEKASLQLSIDRLKKILGKKANEASILSDSLDSMQVHLNSEYSCVKSKSASIIWAKVIQYLQFKELMQVSSINRLFFTKVQNFLKTRSSWSSLISFRLSPRHLSWPIFIKTFNGHQFSFLPPAPIAQTLQGYTSGQLVLSLEITEIVLSICKAYPLLTCYQELSRVCEFLLSSLHTKKDVVDVMVGLLGPPHYLGEIWKPGLLRLRLGIYQVQKIMKLRLPYLYEHFKSIDISLDYIIGPWISSVFTNFCKNNAANKTIYRIWDSFIVQGWSALISACLGLLHLSQNHVIGESLETTLAYYKKRLKSSKIFKSIQQQGVNLEYLDELEKAFYASIQG